MTFRIILIIGFLISSRITSAQVLKLQFDRLSISEVEKIEKSFHGRVFRLPTLVSHDSILNIPLLPAITYERISKRYRTFINYRISTNSFIESIRYSRSASQNDSTLFKSLYERDKKAIKANGGKIENQSYFDNKTSTRLDYWDKPGLHIRQTLSLLKDSDIILYQVFVYWDDN
jgi:hypothetical protein